MKRLLGKLPSGLWVKFIAVTGTEGLNILLTAATGFATIHFLPKDVYGNYVYIVSAINFLLALSELGINHCFLPAIGGRAKEEWRVRTVTRIILSQRFHFWFLSCLLILPYWAWTSFQQGWMRPLGILAFLILLVGSWLGLNEQMFRMNAAVKNRAGTVARSNLSSTIMRAICLFGTFLLLNPSHALPAIALASVLGTLVSIETYRRRGLVLPFGKEEQQELTHQAEIQKQIRSFMAPLIFPSLIFVLYCNFGGMILGWISNGKVIAEAGAVNRLALVLLIVDRLTDLFVSPRLARAKTKSEYRSLALRFQAIYLFSVWMIELSILVFPAIWLILLGHKYSNLESILWLGTLGPILMNISGFTFTMMSCRGYTQHQLPITLLSFCLQIFLYAIWGAPDVWHVFIINIVTAVAFVMGQYLLFARHLSRKEMT